MRSGGIIQTTTNGWKPKKTENKGRGKGSAVYMSGFSCLLMSLSFPLAQILYRGAIPSRGRNWFLKRKKKMKQQNLTFYCKSTDIHIVYKQINSVSVVLKFREVGAFREKNI